MRKENLKQSLLERSEEVEMVHVQVQELENTISEREGRIKELQSAVESFQIEKESWNLEKSQILDDLEAMNGAAEIIKSLESKLEDSINRQSRKTLIFKGINEKPNETWDMTES